MAEALLSDNIEAYETMREALECDHTGEWVVFYDRQLAGIYPDLESAADEAVKRFRRGPYLIRQIGVPAPDLSTSMLHRVLS